jgi:hypothetical protein
MHEGKRRSGFDKSDFDSFRFPVRWSNSFAASEAGRETTIEAYSPRTRQRGDNIPEEPWLQIDLVTEALIEDWCGEPFCPLGLA